MPDRGARRAEPAGDLAHRDRADRQAGPALQPEVEPDLASFDALAGRDRSLDRDAGAGETRPEARQAAGEPEAEPDDGERNRAEEP